MPKNFDKPGSPEEVPDKILMVRGKGEVNLLDKKTHEIKAKANVSPDSIIHANIAYFPAWKVFVNNREERINVRNNGFEFAVPKGESEIRILFDQTTIEKFSNFLSMVGLIILLAGTIFRKKIRV